MISIDRTQLLILINMVLLKIFERFNFVVLADDIILKIGNLLIKVLNLLIQRVSLIIKLS